VSEKHPYVGLPARALWSRGVARQFAADDVVTTSGPLLAPGDRVASIGSCFASNIIPFIEAAGLSYLRMEAPPEQVAMLPEHLGYRDFSAAYGNVYTARQMRQLIERATGQFSPHEDRWHEAGQVIDPFRPGLAYPASNDLEFEVITAAHLAATRSAFETADVVVVTLGLTEGWESTIDGAVFPTCPGTVGGTFAPDRHRFRNFTVAEVAADLQAFIDIVRGLNASSRFIVTVSPVPLVATASGQHVLAATTYSKAVLRVAANETAESNPEVTYFPAYELVTGPQAPDSFFGADRRTVTEEAIKEVMGALLATSGLPIANAEATVASSAPHGRDRPTAAEIGARIAQAECDEALLDDTHD
jgi:hypothetical protein